MSKVITVQDFNRTNFYQLPKAFFYHEKYTGMRNEGKIAYALLRNLLTLSIQKGWVNEKGEIYVKLSREKLMKYLNIKGSQKMSQVMQELLDKELIVEKRLGLNRCNEIYLCYPEELNAEYKDSELLDETEEEAENNVKEKVAEDKENEEDYNIILENIRNFENQSAENRDKSRSFENQSSRTLKIKGQENRKSKVKSFENQRHIKNSKDIKTDSIETNSIIEKNSKELTFSSLFSNPYELGINKHCFNLLLKDIDFCNIDFSEDEYYMALVESIAIACEKDDVEFITMQQYGYLKNTLKNKIDMIK